MVHLPDKVRQLEVLAYPVDRDNRPVNLGHQLVAEGPFGVGLTVFFYVEAADHMGGFTGGTRQFQRRRANFISRPERMSSFLLLKGADEVWDEIVPDLRALLASYAALDYIHPSWVKAPDGLRDTIQLVSALNAETGWLDNSPQSA